MNSEQIRKALARYDRWMSLEHTMVLGDETIHIFAEAARLYADLLENGQEITTEGTESRARWWLEVSKPGRYLVVPVSTTTPRSEK